MDLLSEIQALHSSLAQRGDPGGEQETALLKLIAQRDERVRPLGLALIRHLSGGGGLEILDFEEEEEEASEAPEEVIAEEEPLPLSTPKALDSTDEVTQELHRNPAPPATSAALAALSQGGLKPQWSRSGPPSAELKRRELQGILRDIGRPVRPKTLTQISEAVRTLRDNVDAMDRWLGHPKHIQHALLGLVSSMARHIQDESKQTLSLDDERNLNTLFSRLTRWSADHQPGFVHALSRQNSPAAESWLLESRNYWEKVQQQINPRKDEVQTRHDLLCDLETELSKSPPRERVIRLATQTVKAGVTQSDVRLLSLLLPYAEDLQHAKGLKTLKGKLKAALREDEVSEQQDLSRALPSDWPYRHLTQDKHAVIIGGDPRAQAKRRIEETFGLASLQWEDTDPQRVRSLCTRVEQGSVDLVLIVRSYISHKTIDGLMPACKSSGVAVAVVDIGYGTTQVQLAIERYGQQKVQGASPREEHSEEPSEG